MTDTDFRNRTREVLDEYKRSIQRALAIKDAKRREQRIREMREALKKDHGCYYVREYTVRAHLRKARRH